MMRRSFRSSGVVLFAALAVGACDTQEPTGMNQEPRPEFSVSDDGAPPLTPTGVPYRNPGYKTATGRDGGASLTARALLNQDGSTDLEVTTGELDSNSAPPHLLTKLQIKHLNSQDEPIHTENHNRLSSGYTSYVYEGKPRHSMLQVQGNITVPNASGKGSRTGVVTLRERVNLRPDLAATAIAAPQQAIPGTVVNFFGDIEELNGDLGATANCVFSVDGESSARTDGLWIGEGDLVNCAAALQFDEPGTYTVQMAIEAVQPGDYDLSNNSFSVTIEIVKPTHALHGSAYAEQTHDRRFVNAQNCYDTYPYNNPSGYDCYIDFTDDRRQVVDARFYGSSNHGMSWPVDVQIRQKSGGYVIDQVVLSQWGTSGCQSYSTLRSMINICGSASGTSVQVNRYTGFAVYYTNDTRRYQHCTSSWWFGLDCDPVRSYSTYYYNTSHTWGDGSNTIPGNDYSFEVRVEGQNAMFEANPVMGLQTSSSYSPWYCNGTCYTSETRRTGNVSF